MTTRPILIRKCYKLPVKTYCYRHTFIIEFVYFNYEGEPRPTLAKIKLLKLAERYQLKTLENLCRVALLDVNAEQMASLTANPRSSDGQETNCKIWSDIFLFF